MPEDELRGAVALEAEEFVSRNWSQMDFDYDVVEELPDGKVRVLFVAAPRDLSNERIQCFKSSGLFCGGVTVDSLALTNAFLHSATGAQKEAGVLLLNIGAETTNIVLLNAGQLTVLRDVAFGGNDINEAVMTDFNASFEEAEAIKMKAGDGRASLVESVKRAVEPLLRQVSRTIGYEARRREEAGDLRVCLFGGGSLAPGLNEEIARGIDSPVEHFDPFAKLEVHCGLPDDVGLRSCFAVAVGSALMGEQEP
jgi:type IV pilus assembly protein PilM